MANFLFTQAEAKDLFSEDITVSRHKELKKKANDRFVYIMGVLGTVVGRKWDWFDFDNEIQNNGDPIPGYFDKDDYSEEISFTGEWNPTKNINFDKYDERFPTSWLWTEFENELKKEVQTYEVEEKRKADEIAKVKNDKKNATQNIAAKLPKIKESVYSKAPQEIRNNFVFKSPEKIYAESLRKNNKELEDVERMLEKQKETLRNTLTEEEYATIEFKTPEQILERMKATQMKSSRGNKP